MCSGEVVESDTHLGPFWPPVAHPALTVVFMAFYSIAPEFVDDRLHFKGLAKGDDGR